MPYIDPITGAFVADSLNALPPGYNQASPSDAANIAKMRAAITNQATQAPISSSTPSFIQPIQAAIQNMPGAPVGQAAISMGSDMLGGLLGNLYGAYKGIAGGEYGKNTDIAQQNAALAAQNLHYAPPTQQGQNLVSAINKLPEQITGSSMGIGPLPELMGMNARFTPDDLRVLGKTAVEDVRNFPMDYANAKMGLQREYPTLGSRVAGATDTATNLAKPLAEMAYNQVMETGGIKSPFGMPDIPVANFAVKPKGGNWPTNLGSTLPLSEQGEFGRHLSAVQYDNPVDVFEQQLKKHFERGMDNLQLLRDYEDFLHQYYQNNANGIKYSDLNGSAMQQLKLKAADAFAEAYNDGTIGAANITPTDKKLYTASDIKKTLPAYNSWVMGPYQKYITNQMGTGLATDPLLQVINESNVPVNEIFGQDLPRDWETESITTRAKQRREDFPDRMFGYSDTPEKTATLENSPIGKITATTPEGITYENAIDSSLYPKGRASFINKGGDFKFTDFPFAGKLDRNSLVSDFLTSPEERTGFTEIRKKVFQDLLAGNLDPAKLSNRTPALIVRDMIKEYKEKQNSKAIVQKKKDDWRAARFASLQSDVPYEDGSKMHVITPEDVKADENLAMRDLGLSTIDLNQCVGAGCRNTPEYPNVHGPYIEPHTGQVTKGAYPYEQTHIKRYMERLKNGKLEIARLINPKGVAEATIALDYEAPRVLRLSQQVDAINKWLEDHNPQELSEFENNVAHFGYAQAVKNAYQLYPELYEYIDKLNKKPTKYISEMKGKDNGEIEAKYVPHMVEWLNQHADELTSVRDLGNLKGVHDLDNHYDSIGKMADERAHWYSPTVEEFFKKADDEKLLPRFFTTDQFAQLATDRGVDLSAEPPRKLSDWDKQTLREEVYSVLVKDPNSLYLQDNLKDHVVENLDLLFGDREPEGQLPLDVHRKLADMLLDHNGKYRDQLVSALGQLADKGPNSWTDQFTAQQTKNMLNIMAGWFERHPMEKLPTNADFEKAIKKHPDPFSEIKIPESPWHPTENDLVNAMHEMEPENADEFDQVNAIRQRAYETASEEVRNLYDIIFLRRLYEGDMDARQSIVTDMEGFPQHYGLTNYSPAARNAVIERIAQEGIFWPHENPRNE